MDSDAAICTSRARETVQCTRIELGLSRSATFNATLISTADTPDPSTLWTLLPTALLIESPTELPMLLIAENATSAKTAKMRNDPKPGPLETTTPPGLP